MRWTYHACAGARESNGGDVCKVSACEVIARTGCGSVLSNEKTSIRSVENSTIYSSACRFCRGCEVVDCITWLLARVQYSRRSRGESYERCHEKSFGEHLEVFDLGRTRYGLVEERIRCFIYNRRIVTYQMKEDSTRIYSLNQVK